MKFLSRYYRCIYDFNLFKEYINEKRRKAFLFALPMFLILVGIVFTTVIQDPIAINEGFDSIYDQMVTVQYSDVMDSVGENEFSLNDNLELQFYNGTFQLDQTKVYQTTFEVPDGTYKIIIDTTNLLNIEMTSGVLSNAEEERLGVGTVDHLFYIGDDFIINNYDGLSHTRTLSSVDDTFTSTNELYQFAKSNYVSYLSYIMFAMILVTGIYGMFYIFGLIMVRMTHKRLGYPLAKDRVPKIILYAIQPGIYTYLILTIVNNITNLGFVFIIPLLSTVAMTYVISKTLNNLGDFVKREIRAERKHAKKA